MAMAKQWNPMEDAYKNKNFNKYEEGPGAELDENLQPGAMASGKSGAVDNRFQLCLKNVPTEMSEKAIWNLCANYGKVIHVRQTQKTPYVFVTFATLNDMERALEGIKNEKPQGIFADIAKNTLQNISQNQTQSSSSSEVNQKFQYGQKSDRDRDRQSDSDSNHQPDLSKRTFKGPFTNPARKNFGENRKPFVTEDDYKNSALKDVDPEQHFLVSHDMHDKDRNNIRANQRDNQQGGKHMHTGRAYYKDSKETTDNLQKLSMASQGSYNAEKTSQTFKAEVAQIQYCVLCKNIANKTCQRCGDFYCSVECQRKDWSRHRLFCFPMPELIDPVNITHTVPVNSPMVMQKLDDSIEIKKERVRTASQSSDNRDAHNRSHHFNKNMSQQNGDGDNYNRQNNYNNDRNQGRGGQNRDQGRDQYRDQGRDQNRDQGRDQNRDQGRDQYRDQGRDQNRDQGRDQYRDKGREQNRDKGNNDQGYDQGRGQGRNQGRDQGRDSGSRNPFDSKPFENKKEQGKNSSFENKRDQGKNTSFENKKDQSKNTSFENKKNSSFENQKDQVKNTSFENKKNSPPKPIKIESAEYPKSGSIVAITAVIKPNHVYIRSLESAANVQYVQSVNLINNESKKAKPLDKMPQRGDFAVTDFQGDGFYRVCIINPESADKIRVAYIDFGNIDTKKLSELREIPSEVVGLKRQTFPLILKGVSDFEPMEKITEYLNSYVDAVEKELRLVYESKNGNKIEGELIDTATNDCLNTKVNEIRIIKAPSLDDQPVFIKDIQVKLIPAGENVPLVVLDTSLAVTGAISCIHESDLIEIEKLTLQFSEYAKNTKGPYTPRVGEVCLVLYEDDCWYRAECLEVVGDENPSVLFIDFGNLTTAHISKVRRYPKELIVPCVTNSCWLAGISESDLKEKLANRLKELIPMNDKIIVKKVEVVNDENVVHLDDVLQTLKAEKLL